MFLVLLEGLGIVLGTATLGFTAWLFSTKKGKARGRKMRAWGKRQRKAAGRKITRTGKTALDARRQRKLATPKGQRKARRKAQPHRLTIGHVRAADDPHPARVVARKVGAQVSKARKARQVKRLNRPKRPSLAARAGGWWNTATNGAKPRVTQAAPTGPVAERCGAFLDDGEQCGNRERVVDGVGLGFCYIKAHERQVRDAHRDKQRPYANGARFRGGARLSGAVTRKGASESRPHDGRAKSKTARAVREADARTRQATQAQALQRIRANRPAPGGGRTVVNNGVQGDNVTVTGSAFGPGARVETSATPVSDSHDRWIREQAAKPPTGRRHPDPKPEASWGYHSTNVASGNTTVGSQVGFQGGIVVGPGETANIDGQAVGRGSKVTNRNVRTGNAKVGKQADTIVGKVDVPKGDPKP